MADWHADRKPKKEGARTLGVMTAAPAWKNHQNPWGVGRENQKRKEKAENPGDQKTPTGKKKTLKKRDSDKKDNNGSLETIQNHRAPMKEDRKISGGGGGGVELRGGGGQLSKGSMSVFGKRGGTVSSHGQKDARRIWATKRRPRSSNRKGNRGGGRIALIYGDRGGEVPDPGPSA